MTVLHLLFGWFGLATLIGIAALAVAVLMPALLAALVPNLRNVAIAVAVYAFGFSFIYGLGYADHARIAKAKLEREINAAIEKGEKARADALRRFDALPDGGLPDDGFRRP